MESVQAVRYQAAEVCNAVGDLAENTDNALAKRDAESLLMQMRNYKFIVSLVFWHSLLFQVNYVSKELQSGTITIAARLHSFEKLCT
ncbi:hypothetical protein AVEN_144300-1 [Araneus ventricosus]|uniref:Vinculin n=1 Tax=Araneus ventricosus TaxID=182803 RepID=A0A4Y1ZT53_ARAVE|nr:hypothetical protein AVEN_144300-1 [Araneus ventricosus]